MEGVYEIRSFGMAGKEIVGLELDAGKKKRNGPGMRQWPVQGDNTKGFRFLKKKTLNPLILY